MYISLYRKYRPQKFSEMVGQDTAVNLLLESLREKRLGHAYLFSGPRGCGKTTAARLVAKSLICSSPSESFEPCGECQNCIGVAQGDHLDVIEIDGASNRGINEIRDLKTHVNLKPLSSPFKIYIIDEVHMLTEAAFNALLKTLEEPPQNVIFLLATTEPHKVPVTIRSRCQHIPFHRISIEDMIRRLEYVCAEENIPYDKETLWEISRQADGALRDALSLTEQAIALGKGELTQECIYELTGGSSRPDIEHWVDSLASEPDKCASSLTKMLSGGMSPERFCEALFSVFRDMWLYSLWGDSILESLEVSEAGLEFLKKEKTIWSTEKITQVCELLNTLMPRKRQGMKSDVFSGLILIKIFSIFNGISSYAPEHKTDNTAHIVRISNPAPQPQVIRPVHTEPVSEKKAEPATPTKNIIKDIKTAPVPVPVINDDFSAVLTDNSLIDLLGNTEAEAELPDFSDINKEYALLVSHLKKKKLLIASALLYADITVENEALSIAAENTMAYQVLNNPLNREILIAAAAEAFPGILPEKAEIKEPTPAVNNTFVMPELPEPAKASKPVKKEAEDNSVPEIKINNEESSKIYTPRMMLDLMMAEVLYEDDSSDESDNADRGIE